MNRHKLRHTGKGEIRLTHLSQKAKWVAVEVYQSTAKGQQPHRSIDGILLSQVSNARNTVSPMDSQEGRNQSRSAARETEYPEGKGGWRKRKLLVIQGIEVQNLPHIERWQTSNWFLSEES